MKKYLVSVKGIEYYQEMEIEAKNEEMAEDKYAQMVSDGQVIAVNYDYEKVKVKEVR